MKLIKYSMRLKKKIKNIDHLESFDVFHKIVGNTNINDIFNLFALQNFVFNISSIISYFKNAGKDEYLTIYNNIMMLYYLSVNCIEEKDRGVLTKKHYTLIKNHFKSNSFSKELISENIVDVLKFVFEKAHHSNVNSSSKFNLLTAKTEKKNFKFFRKCSS